MALAHRTQMAALRAQRERADKEDAAQPGEERGSVATKSEAPPKPQAKPIDKALLMKLIDG